MFSVSSHPFYQTDHCHCFQSLVSPNKLISQPNRMNALFPTMTVCCWLECMRASSVDVSQLLVSRILVFVVFLSSFDIKRQKHALRSSGQFPKHAKQCQSLLINNVVDRCWLIPSASSLPFCLLPAFASPGRQMCPLERLAHHYAHNYQSKRIISTNSFHSPEYYGVPSIPGAGSCSRWEGGGQRTSSSPLYPSPAATAADGHFPLVSADANLPTAPTPLSSKSPNPTNRQTAKHIGI